MFHPTVNMNNNHFIVLFVALVFLVSVSGKDDLSNMSDVRKNADHDEAAFVLNIVEKAALGAFPSISWSVEPWFGVESYSAYEVPSKPSYNGRDRQNLWAPTTISAEAGLLVPSRAYYEAESIAASIYQPSVSPPAQPTESRLNGPAHHLYPQSYEHHRHHHHHRRHRSHRDRHHDHGHRESCQVSRALCPITESPDTCLTWPERSLSQIISIPSVFAPELYVKEPYSQCRNVSSSYYKPSWPTYLPPPCTTLSRSSSSWCYSTSTAHASSFCPHSRPSPTSHSNNSCPTKSDSSNGQSSGSSSQAASMSAVSKTSSSSSMVITFVTTGSTVSSKTTSSVGSNGTVNAGVHMSSFAMILLAIVWQLILFL